MMPSQIEINERPGIWKTIVRTIDHWSWRDTDEISMYVVVGPVFIIALIFACCVLFYTDSPVDYYINEIWQSEKFENPEKNVFQIKADIRFEIDRVVATIDTLQEAEIIRDRYKSNLNK